MEYRKIHFHVLRDFDEVWTSRPVRPARHSRAASVLLCEKQASAVKKSRDGPVLIVIHVKVDSEKSQILLLGLSVGG